LFELDFPADLKTILEEDADRVKCGAEVKMLTGLNVAQR